MNAGLVIDHDALPEVCDQRDLHVPGCPCGAGGDPEYLTSALSMLRCSECGGLLDGFGRCPMHGPIDLDLEGQPEFNGAFDRW
jgi:hypothetical protein